MGHECAETSAPSLIRLPGYCPELNRDELLNQGVKTNALGKSRPTNKAQIEFLRVRVSLVSDACVLLQQNGY